MKRLLPLLSMLACAHGRPIADVTQHGRPIADVARISASEPHKTIKCPVTAARLRDEPPEVLWNTIVAEFHMPVRCPCCGSRNVEATRYNRIVDLKCNNCGAKHRAGLP